MTEENSTNHKNGNRVLLIDNYARGFPTDRITRIETIVKESIAQVELKTVHFTQYNPEILKEVIGVIISGSNLNVSSFYFDKRLKKRFNPQLELVLEENNIPILALCFGFHIVAYAYGAQICRMRIQGLGGKIIFILLKETDDLITRKNIPVNTNHRDFVSPNDSKIQEEFEILAISRTKGYRTVQYMRHVDKPIFSLQFHPETHNAYYFHPSLFDERITSITQRVGREIIENFIWYCFYNKKIN